MSNPWVGEETSPAASSNSLWVWRICFKIYPCYTSYDIRWNSVIFGSCCMFTLSAGTGVCVPYRQVPVSRTCFPDLLQHLSIVQSFFHTVLCICLRQIYTPGNSLSIDMLLMLIPNFEFLGSKALTCQFFYTMVNFVYRLMCHLPLFFPRTM